MCTVHADDIGQVTVFEALTELGGVAVSRIGEDQRRRHTPGVNLVDHLETEAPFLLMRRVGRHRGLTAALAGLGRGSIAGRIPGLRDEQAPVHWAGRGVGDQIQADPDLAVGHFPGRAGVLAGHTYRRGAAFEPAGVVQRPRRRIDRLVHPHGQPLPHRSDIPRAVRDEMVQCLLMRPGKPGRHRLDRLTPPVQHQPTQIPARPILPAGTRQRREHITGELGQIITQPLNLNDVHTSTTAPGLTRSHHQPLER
jgi:hypothetical protein